MGSLLEKQWQLRPLPLTSAPGLVGLLPDTFAPGWSSPSAEPAEKRRCLDCKHCACAGTQRAPFSSHSDLHSIHRPRGRAVFVPSRVPTGSAAGIQQLEESAGW